MDLGLRDKVAIVTGGSRGIGRSIALAFAAEGCRVAICARGEEALRQTEAGLRGLGGDGLGIEAVERLPVGFPFPEDSLPAQSGLGAVQKQKLEKPLIVMPGHPPLPIVILGHPDALGPWTPRNQLPQPGNPITITHIGRWPKG